MPEEPRKAKHLSKWFVLRLRSALVLVFVVALTLGWFAWDVRDQRETKETILRHNGVFFYEYEPQTVTQYERVNWTPAWLRKAIDEDYFHDVTMIRIEGEQFGDAELERLEALDRIEALGIVQTAITDDGLRHLRGRKALKSLWLGGNWIGDAGIDNLGLETLPNLEVLEIRQTLVSEAKVAEIQHRFPKLMILNDGTSHRYIIPGEGRGDHRFGMPEEVDALPTYELPPPRFHAR